MDPLKNQEAGQCIVDELFSQGVGYFCAAPGSRNTPLLLALAEHPHAEKMVHWDERGLGFHALGFAKAKEAPAAIFVTSGTAVANLFPAIMEAHHSQIPLVVITADRPPELRDCGSNQTTDQIKIFRDFTRWQIDLPCPEECSESFIQKAVAYAVFRAKGPTPGPVHINCMFREPLHRQEPYFFSGEAKTTYYSFPPQMQGPVSLSSRKGLILVGRLPDRGALQEIYALAEHLKWPIFGDLLSQARIEKGSSCLISSFDLMLKTMKVPVPETILHFGDRFVSKKLLEWLSEIRPKEYSLILPHAERYDPAHLFTRRFHASSASFCKAVKESIPQEEDSSWLLGWQEKDLLLKNLLGEEKEAWSEGEIIRTIGKCLPEEWGIFFGNSMPIRDADQFFFPENSLAGIFANRGVSGIDGNIATCFGLAQGLQKPLVSCIGDLAFLHDLNSLALAEKCRHPVLFLVLNNAGGGIFSFLSVAKEKEHFDTFFRAKHNLSFEGISEQFNLTYQRVDHRESFLSHFHSMLAQKKSAILEVTVDARANVSLREILQQRVQEKVL